MLVTWMWGVGSNNGEKTQISDRYGKPRKQGCLRIGFLFLSFSTPPKFGHLSLPSESPFASSMPLILPSEAWRRLRLCGKAMNLHTQTDLSLLSFFFSLTATPKSSFDPHHRSQPSYERPSYLPPGPGLMLRQKSIGMSPGRVGIMDASQGGGCWRVTVYRNEGALKCSFYFHI